MKRTKKILAMLLCAVLLVTGTVAVTVAYLKSTTTIVKNTFTIGELEITLDETKVDEYGNAVESEERVTANTYKLIPGHTYLKDPTVHVKAGSEESYVFMKVIINGYDQAVAVYGNDFLPQDVVTGWYPNIWVSTEEINVSEDGKTAEYVFYYSKKVEDTLELGENETLDLEPLFTNIVMGDELTNEQIKMLNGVVIDVQAYAIQADGFDITKEADLLAMQEALGLIVDTTN